MELSLTSLPKDNYPVCGFFIEDTNLTGWLDALHHLGLNPLKVEIHGLPSMIANQVWGCLVLADPAVLPDDLGKYLSACQVGRHLIIPEKTKVIPELTAFDFKQLFQDNTYVLHPDFGLFRLTEPIPLDKHVHLNEGPVLNSVRPKDFHFLSGEIKGFSVQATPKEEIKLALESTEKREKLENKPLTLSEKLRLELYKKFLITEEGKDGEITLNPQGSALEKIARQLGIYGPDQESRIMEDFKNLQERNKKEVDKLLDLLKDNPEDALRYAIPLEEHGYTRGG